MAVSTWPRPRRTKCRNEVLGKIGEPQAIGNDAEASSAAARGSRAFVVEKRLRLLLSSRRDRHTDLDRRSSATATEEQICVCEGASVRSTDGVDRVQPGGDPGHEASVLAACQIGSVSPSARHAQPICYAEHLGDVDLDTTGDVVWCRGVEVEAAMVLKKQTQEQPRRIYRPGEGIQLDRGPCWQRRRFRATSWKVTTAENSGCSTCADESLTP